MRKVIGLIIALLSVGTIRAEHIVLEDYKHLELITDTLDGFAVVSRTDSPMLLIQGCGELIIDNLPNEFYYLLNHYEQLLSQGLLSSNRHKIAARKANFKDISPMLTTKWGQSSPYNDLCPFYENSGTRCVTGCVATAMAQVLNYWQLPKNMRGSKTYGYTNKNGHRVTHSFDYSKAHFDWDLMQDGYNSTASEESRKAVATLMYACGVATNMDYGIAESGANPWVGADGINCFFDGLRAEYTTFNTDVVLSELQAGRPVIYAGTNPTSGGAHCFVIDGARSDGYFYCNMGWGNTSITCYYLPTDMSGYNTQQNIVRVWPSTERTTYNTVTDLQSKFATASSEASTKLNAGQWYVLWNAGRAGSPRSNGLGQPITNTSMLPTDEATQYCAPQLIRLVATAGGGYYIQTGTGEYWNKFSAWGGTGSTTSSAESVFNINTIKPGYYSIYNNGCYLDTNGPGSTVVGWNTQAPTDTVSNSSWRFYPINLNDVQMVNFNGRGYYRICNTGYSQGYLVATTPEDTHPTLRGVTQNHTNGLYAGAAYRQEMDTYNKGSYWTIETRNGKHYMRNAGTNKFITNTGNRSCYIFTPDETAVNITRVIDGTYRINAGSDSQSFLCAATHLANPAAFWTSDDRGAEWTFEYVETIPIAAESLTLNVSKLEMNTGAKVALTATLMPASISKVLNWNSSNTSVATVSSTGLVTAVSPGTTIISVTTPTNAALRAECVVTVRASTSPDNFTEIRTDVYYGIMNPQTSAYLVASPYTPSSPTLRGVITSTPELCADAQYLTPADLSLDYSKWQLKPVEGTSNQFYIYNIGLKRYLVHGSDGNSYQLSGDAQSMCLTDAGLSVFRINRGTGMNYSRTYLSAQINKDCPAGCSAASDLTSYWRLEQLEEVSSVEDININTQTLNLIVGATAGLSAWIIPSSAAQDIDWQSTNPAVASVTSYGLISALSPGVTTIIATAHNDPSHHTSCVVTVTAPVPSFTTGDVNNDGAINVGDLTALVSIILGSQPSEYIYDAADMNNDGIVNVTDYTFLVNTILQY